MEYDVKVKLDSLRVADVQQVLIEEDTASRTIIADLKSPDDHLSTLIITARIKSYMRTSISVMLYGDFSQGVNLFYGDPANVPNDEQESLTTLIDSLEAIASHSPDQDYRYDAVLNFFQKD